MNIVTYPHPTLRYKSKSITKVDAELRKIVEEMFELMYEAQGVGLAANQVDLPLRLFVCNPAGKKDEGEEFVFINPELSRPKGTDAMEEGCLSIPGVREEVIRPAAVHLEAYDMKGQSFNANIDGFLAKIVQHENDHLNGVLFVDRVSETGKIAVDDALYELELDFKNRVETGLIPPEADIMDRLKEWEAKYCS